MIKKAPEADNGALRFNEGKPGYHLFDPAALEAVARVFEYGAKKYAPRNWERGMKWTVMFNSLIRHSWAWLRGEEIDPESGCLHMAHVAWNALGLCTYHLRKIGQDDRIMAEEAAPPPPKEPPHNVVGILVYDDRIEVQKQDKTFALKIGSVVKVTNDLRIWTVNDVKPVTLTRKVPEIVIETTKPEPYAMLVIKPEDITDIIAE